jgi:hypothetical protein
LSRSGALHEAAGFGRKETQLRGEYERWRLIGGSIILRVVRKLYWLIAQCHTDITPEERQLVDELVWEPAVNQVAWYRRPNPQSPERRREPPVRLEFAVVLSPGTGAADELTRLASRVREIPHIEGVSLHEREVPAPETHVVRGEVADLNLEGQRYAPEPPSPDVA